MFVKDSISSRSLLRQQGWGVSDREKHLGSPPAPLLPGRNLPNPRISFFHQLARPDHRGFKILTRLRQNLPVRGRFAQNVDRAHRGKNLLEAFVMFAARRDPDAVDAFERSFLSQNEIDFASEVECVTAEHWPDDRLFRIKVVEDKPERDW